MIRLKTIKKNEHQQRPVTQLKHGFVVGLTNFSNLNVILIRIVKSILS